MNFEELYKKYESLIKKREEHFEKDEDNYAVEMDDEYADWEQDLWEINEELSDVSGEFKLKPDCCDNEGLNWFAGDIYDGIPSGWYISLNSKKPKTIKVCPFCATKLPEVVIKNPIPNYVHVPYGEDYCGTCSERNRCCYCFPPEAAYEIKKEE